MFDIFMSVCMACDSILCMYLLSSKQLVSNSKEVIRRIPEQDRADGVKELDLDLDSLPLERALGVHWCVESDCFQFAIVLQDKPCTRRGILSTVSSTFDPLGFVAPLLLDGKPILQDLCRHEVGWDDLIPEDIKVKWEKWRSDLLEVQRISIPRCYKPDDFGRVVSAQLHHFSDASVKGYGQCSYLRLVDENQRVHCSFVMGKSRVAPLKPVTIPRLELTAAVCSVRISQQLRRELEYTINKEYFWTVFTCSSPTECKKFKKTLQLISGSTSNQNKTQQMKRHEA